MTYLIVHGEVEVGPGMFEPGVVSSSPHPSREAAETEWSRMVEAGLYEEPFERPEFREDAPTLGEVLPEVAA